MERCLNKNISPVGLPWSTGIHKDLPHISLAYQAYCHHLTGSPKEQDYIVLLTLDASQKGVSVKKEEKIHVY